MKRPQLTVLCCQYVALPPNLYSRPTRHPGLHVLWGYCRPACCGDRQPRGRILLQSDALQTWARRFCASRKRLQLQVLQLSDEKGASPEFQRGLGQRERFGVNRGVARPKWESGNEQGHRAEKPVDTGENGRSLRRVSRGLRYKRETVAAEKMVEAAGIEPASGCPSSGPSTWVVVLFGSQPLAARRRAASQPSLYWVSSVAAEATLTDQPADDVRPALAGEAPETGYPLLGSHQHAVVGICCCARCFKGPPRNPSTQAPDKPDPVETSRPHSDHRECSLYRQHCSTRSGASQFGLPRRRPLSRAPDSRGRFTDVPGE